MTPSVSLYGFLCLVVQTTVTLTQANNTILPANVECGPYLYYVHTTNGTYEHTPFVVQLHRCHGKSSRDAVVTKCAPTQTANVDIYVFSPQAPYGAVITMVNHTRCTDVCYHSNETCNQYETWDETFCKCLCKQSAAPSNCVAPFNWDSLHCDCRCPFNSKTYQCNYKNQLFDVDSCGCVCDPYAAEQCRYEDKYLDPATCTCIKKPNTGQSIKPNCLNAKGKVVITVVVVVEAIVILVLFYLFNQYSNLLKRVCYRKGKSMNFEKEFFTDKPDGKTDNVTPTMTFSSDPEGNESSKRILYCNASDNNTDKYFLFHDSLSRRNKYRYEMGHVTPVFYNNNERSKPVTTNCSSVSYNDVDEVSNNSTFNLTDSLASVTRI